MGLQYVLKFALLVQLAVLLGLASHSSLCSGQDLLSLLSANSKSTDDTIDKDDVVRSWKNLETSTTVAGPLMCTCTPGESNLCPSSGICNAEETAKELVTTLKQTRSFVAILAEFPGDMPRKIFRDEICKELSSSENITDLLLLDFENWEPACIRYPGEVERHACSMAPANFSVHHQSMSKEELNDKIRDLFKHFGCQDFSAPVLTEDPIYCRHSSHCNIEDLPTPPPFVIEDDAEIEIAVAGFHGHLNATNDDNSTLTTASMWMEDQRLFLYLVIPAIVLCVVLLLVFIVFCCWYKSLWHYVYTVSDEERVLDDKVKATKNLQLSV